MMSHEGVDDETYDAVAALLPARQVVEITMSAAFYAMVAHTTRALRIPHDAEGVAGQYGQR